MLETTTQTQPSFDAFVRNYHIKSHVIVSYSCIPTCIKSLLENISQMFPQHTFRGCEDKVAVVEIGQKKKNESSQGGQAMNSLRAKRQCSGLWKDIALFPVSMGRLWLTWITLDFSILRYAVFWNANDYSSLSSCSAYIYIYYISGCSAKTAHLSKITDCSCMFQIFQTILQHKTNTILRDGHTYAYKNKVFPQSLREPWHSCQDNLCTGLMAKGVCF